MSFTELPVSGLPFALWRRRSASAPSLVSGVMTMSRYVVVDGVDGGTFSRGIPLDESEPTHPQTFGKCQNRVKGGKGGFPELKWPRVLLGRQGAEQCSRKVEWILSLFCVCACSSVLMFTVSCRHYFLEGSIKGKRKEWKWWVSRKTLIALTNRWKITRNKQTSATTEAIAKYRQAQILFRSHRATAFEPSISSYGCVVHSLGQVAAHNKSVSIILHNVLSPPRVLVLHYTRTYPQASYSITTLIPLVKRRQSRNQPNLPIFFREQDGKFLEKCYNLQQTFVPFASRCASLLIC